MYWVKNIHLEPIKTILIKKSVQTIKTIPIRFALKVITFESNTTSTYNWQSTKQSSVIEMNIMQVNDVIIDDVVTSLIHLLLIIDMLIVGVLCLVCVLTVSYVYCCSLHSYTFFSFLIKTLLRNISLYKLSG